MKTSRIFGGAVAMLSLFAAGHASAEGAAGETVVLNTFSTVLVKGSAYPGPQQNGVARIGKNTGAGVMDSSFDFDAAAAKKDPTKVLLMTAFTRSATIKNENAANDSYMQGGFALATLTDKGVTPGPIVDLPRLTGERTWMRPINGFSDNGYVVLMAASEDNGVNNNPMPVLFLAKKDTGALVAIPNNTRGQNNAATKPTNLIQQALKDGIQVQNPNNQRGPHSIVKTGPNTFVVGMQYNNQAQEAYSVTVQDNGAIKMNWLKRYSNVAQHCRPHVAAEEGATEGYIAAVEANNQPAEIGFRVTKFNLATGQAITSKIAVRSDPQGNKYVSEPVIAMVGGKIAISYGLTASVQRNRGNDNGHAGGGMVAAVALFSPADLSMTGAPLLNAGPYGRHPNMFATTYGPNAEPAIAVIGGSSTGTKGAFEQLIPLKADGTLGLKDAAKLYAVSTYSDVANVQARGKRNPNNQARGFINGLGGVPNPGYKKGATAFMPEVKAFSFSMVTGYENQLEADVGKRNSITLSLVPAAWDPALKTTPGSPTDKPGTGPDGLPSTTGPAPRSTTPPTDPSGGAQSKEDTNVLEGTDPTTEGGGDTGRAALGSDNGGCSVSHSSTSSSGAGFIFLAIAGVIIALRRKQEGV